MCFYILTVGRVDGLRRAHETCDKNQSTTCRPERPTRFRVGTRTTAGRRVRPAIGASRSTSRLPRSRSTIQGHGQERAKTGRPGTETFSACAELGGPETNGAGARGGAKSAARCRPTGTRSREKSRRVRMFPTWWSGRNVTTDTSAGNGRFARGRRRLRDRRAAFANRVGRMCVRSE